MVNLDYAVVLDPVLEKVLVQLDRVIHIVKLFQLKYRDVVNEEHKSICKTMYKEESNAFCYYVITSLMMNFFDATIQWLQTNQKDLFYFDKSERQVMIFCYYIRQKALDDTFISLMDELSDVCQIKKHNDMKLSLFEIQVK